MMASAKNELDSRKGKIRTYHRKKDSSKKGRGRRKAGKGAPSMGTISQAVSKRKKHQQVLSRNEQGKGEVSGQEGGTPSPPSKGGGFGNEAVTERTGD